MYQNRIYFIVFIVLFAFLTQAQKCADGSNVPGTSFERVPALRLYPNPFYKAEPAFDFPKHVEVKKIGRAHV